MGCYLSKKLGYAVLRKSIPGALLTDEDFPAFYALCRTDTHTLTSQIHINENQLFYVVVSGEVVVNLTQSDSRAKAAITYGPGEMIHFFHGSESISANGTLSSGPLTLSLSFVSTTTPSIIIGADRHSIERFLKNRPHLTRLKTLMQLNLTNFLSGAGSLHFRSLTYKQLNILGPMLKLRLSVESERIRYTGKEVSVSSPLAAQRPMTSRSARDSLRSLTSPAAHASNKRSAHEVDALNNHFRSALRGRLIFSPTFVVLHGMVESLDVAEVASLSVAPHRSKPKSKVASLINSLRSAATPTSSKYNKVHCDEDSSAIPLNVMIPTSPQGDVVSPPAGSAAVTSNKQITPNISQSPRHRHFIPGAIVGLEHFLCGKMVNGLPDSKITGDFAILGHLDLNMLKVLASLDRRVQRVLNRNFVMRLLDSFRDHVPMLSDMDEKAYTMLCSTITLKSYSPGEVIYKQNDPSNFAYIVIHGSVVECIYDGDPPTISKSISKSASYSPHPVPSGRSASGRDLEVVETPAAPQMTCVKLQGTTSLFGEVALVTETPYPTTASAAEPTLLVSISKSAFNEIYNNNKSTLAEIRIRMAGAEIGLQPILDHPTGCKLFHDFVEENRAAENVLFYKSADKFDEMCSRLKQQMVNLRGAGSSTKQKSILFDDGGANTMFGGAGNTIHNNSVSPKRTAELTDHHNQGVSLMGGGGGVGGGLGSGGNSVSLRLETIKETHSASDKLQIESTAGTGDSHKLLRTSAPESLAEESEAISDTHSVLSVNHRGVTSPSPVIESQVEQDEPLPSIPEGAAEQPALPQRTSFSTAGVRLTPLIIAESPTEQLDDVLVGGQNSILEGFRDSQPNSLYVGGLGAASTSNYFPAMANSIDPITPSQKEESNKLTKLKFQKIEKTTAELQEVARTIMERYINEGAPCEINIPQTMRANTQRIFEDWINTHKHASVAASAKAAPPMLGDGEPSPAFTNSTWSINGASGKLSPKGSTDNLSALGASGKVKRHMNTPFFQLDFCDMFREPKEEILKLLRRDLFMRWKKTKDFQHFITNLKPYEELSMHSNHSRSSMISDHLNGGAPGSNPNSFRKAGSMLSRENSGLKAVSLHRQSL